MLMDCKVLTDMQQSFLASMKPRNLLDDGGRRPGLGHTKYPLIN